MSKSSIDYCELSGLRIALSNLELIDVTYQDDDWVAITEWMKERIKFLTNK